MPAQPFHLPSSGPRTKSEACAAAEAEELRAIVARLGQRDRNVDSQRTERRLPDDAGTNRAANLIAVADVVRDRLASHRPACRALVIPQGASIDIDGALQT